MKTLYVRIVLTFMGIALLSCIIGLLLTNVYYQEALHTKNQEKIWNAGHTIASMLEHTSAADRDARLAQIASLGYQIYYVDEHMQGTSYGSPFKHGSLQTDIIRSVLNGNLYKGVNEENRRLMLFSFFENSLRNTIGLPVKNDTVEGALFVRPDLEQQIGEVRIIVAVLLGATFVVSLLLIALLSRFIIRPVKALTAATKRIADGQYDVALDVSRKDELGDLAHNFTKMSRSIQQMEQMRQEFVANVSHELQSPLTSIQGLAQASLASLEEGARTSLDRPEAKAETEDDLAGSPGSGEQVDKQAVFPSGLQDVSHDSLSAPLGTSLSYGKVAETRQSLQIIEQESRRLSALSKQLLTLASLDNEKREIRKSLFRLDEQIRQIIIMLEWQWSEKKLQLELELPEMQVSGDPHLLYEVWLNLITNAIKFSSAGDKLAVQLAEENESAVVTIRDTGAGIPPAAIAHLFERFYKADKARSRAAGGAGSGLGLAIVHTIVTLHGGRITVASELGQGSTFTVYLPPAE